jgi:8-oxo-dGTP pyrophosphatase MutT (NUDIX family)
VDDYPDLIGETPPLIGPSALNLAHLAGPEAERSTGLVLTWRDRLVWAIEPGAVPLGAQGQAGVLAFVGIGGHLDPGEGWTQAVRREAHEEACCAISLADSPVTYLCRRGATPEVIAHCWNEAERPLLVWVATFSLRRGPAGEREPITLVNAVFRAAALNRPTPGSEVRALLALDQDQLLLTYRAPRPLGQLMAGGAQVIGRMPSPTTLVAPGGSAWFYAHWLAWQEDAA